MLHASRCTHDDKYEVDVQLVGRSLVSKVRYRLAGIVHTSPSLPVHNSRSNALPEMLTAEGGLRACSLRHLEHDRETFSE